MWKFFLEGYRSSSITVHRGVKQGCLLSLLLFNISIETLTIAVRAIAVISGVRTPMRTHKLMLYADDMVFLLQDPVTPMKALGNLLDLFARVLRYKINFSKSMKIGLNITPETRKVVAIIMAAAWSSCVKYLCIKLPKSTDLTTLTDLNLKPIINSTRAHLEH